MVKKRKERKESYYKIRILSCVVLVEIIAIAIINFWPVQEGGGTSYRDVSYADEDIMFEEVQITRQESRPPPPPKPRVPVPVPNDQVIEEEIPDLDNLNISEDFDPMSEGIVGEEGDSDRVVTNPQSGPSVIRIVEPTTPDEAKKANIQVEVWVTFLVDQEGRVEEANISQIRLYNGAEDEFETVQTIGYGITESTLKAALQWKFRPATDNGQPVKAYTRHIFTYGF